MIDDRCESKLLLEENRISYEELKKHSTYADAWIAINGLVYDITNFIPKHPFGDTFRGNLGTDCSGLFSSAHIHMNTEKLMKNERFLQENDIKLVGRLDINQDYLHKDNGNKYLDRIVYKKLCNDEFWLELKARVHEYLIQNNESTHYSVFEGISYLLYYLAIFVLLSYFTWVNSSILSAALLGFHMVCVSAGMSHMVAHFGFTRNKLLNFIALHLMDLGGYSCLEWQIAHQTHHNQPHSSIDYQTNQYAPIRIHEYVKYNSYHKYQYIYFWIGILFYHARIFPMSTIWIIKSREFLRHKYEVIAHVFTRIAFLSLVVYCGHLHGILTALTLLIIYSISYSFFAFILLYNDHEENHSVLALNENVNLYHEKLSWAETQVRTSGNWYPTNWILAFVEFHYGYFNYHIEHHLFPAFKPSLLKKISPIVKQVCHKYDIPYISTSFVEVHKSFQRHITKMGLPEKS
ncbi:MAG: fatty acid desaturase [Cyanobacteria bacterium P01_F01_bin.86]